MRRLLPLLLCASCATTTTTTAPSTPEPPPTKTQVNVAGLHPAASSRTVGDARALPGLSLVDLGLERDAFVGEGAVDPWLSRRLLSWLVAHGSAPQLMTTTTTTTNATTNATTTKKMARLVGVRFRRSTDDVAVAVVAADGGGVNVRYWAGKGDESLCAPALPVQLTYVQLEATLVDANDRWVASIAEVVAVEPASAVVEVDGDVCEALAKVFTDDLLPSEEQLNAAADAGLDEGFRQVLSLLAPPK